MVNDHSKANSELMSLTSGRGVTLPTALPADKQKHLDDMRKMTGKAFDKHYMDMMVNDHKKTIADFEKEASAGSDADLKTFATKTLPTLQKHRDSAVAINKAKM
jgi:putative membrane protein